MKKIVITASIALGAIMATNAPASGQIWIGQIAGEMAAQGQAAAERHRCMMGDPMPADEVAEARGPTVATMQSYFEAMQNGGPARSTFFNLNKRTAFVVGEETFSKAQVDVPADTFAQGGAVIDAEPKGYARSGLQARTHAQFDVRSAAGELIGTYSGIFVRKRGSYLIEELRLTPTGQYVAPVEQFCFEPGDVLPYRLTSSETAINRAEHAIIKADKKLLRWQEKLAKAEEKQAKRPNNVSVRKSVQTARAQVEKWQTRKSVEQEKLATAKTDLAAAQADKAKAEADRASAIAAIEA